MAREIALSALADLIGQELGVSQWTEISQRRIDQFAAVTGDHQWMHVDVPRATRERGGTIAHGLLTLSLLPMLSDELMRVTGYTAGFSYGFDKVRFTRPVPAGKRVRLRQTVTGVDPTRGGQLVRIACVVEIEGEERPALVAEHLSLYYAA